MLGELHVPGRLRIWHIMREFRRLRLWSHRPLALLDAGGGKGALAYFLARKFRMWTVVVADNDRRTIERGRQVKANLRLHNLELHEVDLRCFNEESRYEIVVCSDVLEHIQEDEEIAKRLARALRPGGVLIVTSPSVPQPKHLPLVARRERRIGFAPSDYGHVRQGYSHERLRQLMEGSGLEVDRIRWTFGRFGTLMFDLFFITGDDRPNPFVYAALFPLYMMLSFLDVTIPIRHGAAVLGVGRKP